LRGGNTTSTSPIFAVEPEFDQPARYGRQKEMTMLNAIGIALAAAIVLGASSWASAAVIQEASNHSSQYGNPADTPNGPFFYVDTYGVQPAVPRHAPRHRPPNRHN
jgi:hypothetical protein